MRNLKKTLAVVLAFAMVFSMGIINTFAFSDVEAGTVVDEAVGILSNLGILEGFEDGTFKPEESVTRAQMAAIICRTLGYESQAQSSKGVTMFNDVAADHWASGYINVAQAQQIINGYGDGNFGPEDKVTYEQAVKMIVAALNYDLVAQAKGGYPTGYLAVASAEGITKSANGRVGDAAKRATVATLVYNSLEVRLMDQKSWSTGTSGNEFGKTNETILSQYLNVEKWEGIVSSTPAAQYAQNGYTADAEVTLGLDATKLIKYENGVLVADEEAEYLPADCSLVDANKFAGKKVVAYIGEDEDAETGERMVYAIAEKKGANKTVTINANQLIESGSNFTKEGKIYYRNAGSNKAYYLELDTDAEYSVNFVGNNAAGTLTTQGLAQIEVDEDANTLAENGGTITFISNDNDADYERIQITAYTGEAVIEEVENEDGIISFDTYDDTDSIEDIDTEDEDLLVIVYKDGVLADVNALAANDTVSIIELKESFKVLYASSKTVTGIVAEYNKEDQYVTIAGADYKASGFSSYHGEVENLAKYEGVFFLNVDGQIAYADASAAKGNYGLVLSVKADDGEYTAEVLLADGTVAKYPIYKKASITGVVTNTASSVAKKLANLMTGSDDLTEKRFATIGKAKGLLFEVTIKNGEIRNLVSVGTTDDPYTGMDYDAENNSYGAYDFDDSTVVFSLSDAYDAEDTDQEEDRIEAADVKVGKIADYFVDGEGDGFKFFAYDDEDIVGAIMGFNFKPAVPADADAVIVTGTKTVIYNDDKAYRVTGLQGGEKVTYTIYSEDDYTSSVAPEYLRAGDVIMVAAADADGFVSDFKTIFKKVQIEDEETEEIIVAAGLKDTATSDGVAYAYGTLTGEATNSKFFLAADGRVLNDLTAEKIVNGIALKESANYTLVDCTEEDSVEISKKSKGKSIFGSSRHTSQVLVRYYDDKLVEVIVYRTLAPEA